MTVISNKPSITSLCIKQKDMAGIKKQKPIHPVLPALGILISAP